MSNSDECLARFVTKYCDVTNSIGSKLPYKNNGLLRGNEQYYNIHALSMIACFASSQKFLLMAQMGKKLCNKCGETEEVI